MASEIFIHACHISNRENEFNCKTVLIRKVMNFIEKNACTP